MAKYRVLIAYAYGIKAEFTQGIAEEIAAVLREDGFDTELRPAAEVVSVGPYDAVVLGGALRANRWHRDARRFARRHAAQLRSRPVWLFSSGPSSTSASEPDVPPVPGASRAMNRAGARGHITFGSRSGRRGRPGRYGSADGPVRPARRLRGLLDRSAADRDRDQDRARPDDNRDPYAEHQDMTRVRDWAHHIANEVNGP
ncbi:flavodoxin domain-containing protein [Streptomyces ochraceiscleroticus]|uniref:Flavodoxin domain-containing protein n=1 Tax=Streptomyces ochraceiscleroticus TaxID=47761 RepID=A0ABW1MSJ0_9ACTN|nr:flavodoxin domain-containing protein [Streptomyces ochraceiscleroticus]